MRFSKEELEQIISICVENGINSNVLGRETPIGQPTAHRFLNRTTANPSESTVVHILDYLKVKVPSAFENNSLFKKPFDSSDNFSRIVAILSELSLNDSNFEMITELKQLVQQMFAENTALKSENMRQNKTLKKLYADIKKL